MRSPLWLFTLACVGVVFVLLCPSDGRAAGPGAIVSLSDLEAQARSRTTVVARVPLAPVTRHGMARSRTRKSGGTCSDASSRRSSAAESSVRERWFLAAERWAS
jgi:hypothetical protein